MEPVPLGPPPKGPPVVEIAVACIVVLLIVAAYVLGRSAAAEKVRVETVTEIVEVEKEVERIKVIEVKVQDEKRDTRTVRTEVRTPDGTVTIREEAKETAEIKSRTDSEKTGDTERTTTRNTDTSDRPVRLWKATALAGVQVRESPQFVVGGLVERQVVDRVSAGVWALNNGTAGLSLSVEF